MEVPPTLSVASCSLAGVGGDSSTWWTGRVTALKKGPGSLEGTSWTTPSSETSINATPPRHPEPGHLPDHILHRSPWTTATTPRPWRWRWTLVSRTSIVPASSLSWILPQPSVFDHEFAYFLLVTHLLGSVATQLIPSSCAALGSSPYPWQTMVAGRIAVGEPVLWWNAPDATLWHGQEGWATGFSVGLMNPPRLQMESGVGLNDPTSTTEPPLGV